MKVYELIDLLHRQPQKNEVRLDVPAHYNWDDHNWDYQAAHSVSSNDSGYTHISGDKPETLTIEGERAKLTPGDLPSNAIFQ